MTTPSPGPVWVNHETLFMPAFTLMLTHEFDAVARLEWRVLPLTSWLPDDMGFRAFVAAHGPMVIAILHWAFRAGVSAGERLRWFCLFCASCMSGCTGCSGIIRSIGSTPRSRMR
jgi:hypothetical protein